MRGLTTSRCKLLPAPLKVLCVCKHMLSFTVSRHGHFLAFKMKKKRLFTFCPATNSHTKVNITRTVMLSSTVNVNLILIIVRPLLTGRKRDSVNAALANTVSKQSFVKL